MTGAKVGNKYSLERLLVTDGDHAWFLATSLQSSSESIVFSLQPAEREIAGWPSHILGLRHPHLRRVLGAGKEVIAGREWLCVAMERTDSLLASRLVGQDSLPLEDVRDLAGQLVDALRYLHGKNLVCRNLKPETIAAAGGSWKIADYTALGPARQADPRETRQTLTQSPHVPPDAYLGLISPAWDIYSLGVTINQCLGGRLRLPDPFGAIVSGCLDPNPEKRISLDGIEKWLRKGAPAPVARPVSPDRKRAWAWLTATSLILFFEAVLLLYSKAPSVRSAPPQEQHDRTVISEAASAAVSAPVPAAPVKPDPAEDKRQIEALLGRWISTLRARDLEAHVACYASRVAPFLDGQAAQIAQVRREKELLLKRIGPIRRLEISDLAYGELAGDRAVVTLRKEWDVAPPNPTSGVEDEKLTLQRVDGKWKIAGEEESNVRAISRS
ncbi:MAG TPA: hypothetical protein VL285_20740 [Bryobacteraceae bacterium]|nr:hypothetical protein [Bryobacteraceae bacterium]